MSRNLIKKKKSTSKYRKFKVSPLIPVIALLEAIVLIGISTYAWFIVVQEKEANTGIITVDADSGLDIDFKNANYDDEINIWDYVEDDFKFEPVTSLDGRNIFVPTSGTFNSTDTTGITFREATINDINTKYLNIDFILTNTDSSNMDVFLSNKSEFKVYNGANDQNSRALRLAFYKNDGNHGSVDSSILENTKSENIALDQLTNKTTVYFQKPDNWGTVYAYLWKKVDNTNYVAVTWPGSIMSKVAGTYYSYTFQNTANYDKIIFSNGEKTNIVTYNGSNASTATQTRDLDLVNGHLYKLRAGDTGYSLSGEDYTTKTVYFIKPGGWSGVRAHAFKSTGNNTSFTRFPGDECTYVGGDVYSYSFPGTYNNENMGGILFNNLANSSTKTNDIDENVLRLGTLDGKLVYINNNGSSGACTVMDYELNTIYFYNSQGFGTPYIKAKADSDNRGGHTTEIAMTNLSANIFYANVPSYYNNVSFEDGTGQGNTSKFTQYADAVNGNIYRPASNTTSSGRPLTFYAYSDYAGNGNYAVISPGVSAGFQRSYTPVVDIDPDSGDATQLIPAFASSLDNYLKASEHPMFTLAPQESIELSMIVWLEGTDSDCTTSIYANKQIKLDLYFSTTNVHYTGSDDVTPYTFRFYDKTREVWTSDRLTNSAGVSVSPVMQLYDATEKRGYLMHAASVTNVYSEVQKRYMDKIDLWECDAPSTIISHNLFFRRVDPYNEDEVWNYWHPVNCSSVFDDAKTVIGNKTYINFTAFADGAPASTTDDSAAIPSNTSVLTAANSSHANTPAWSCGGLWGVYETTLLTAVDGTNGRWLANDSASLTLRYTYKYPQTNVTHTIEYKASGAFGKPYGIFYFVVPKVLKENSTVNGTTVTGGSERCSSYTVHRFWGFNGNYAMNIKERNSNMNFSTTCSPQTNTAMTGYYLWLGQTLNNGGYVDQHWFGTSLTYINLSTTNEDNNQNVMDNGRFKAHVWNSSSNTDIMLYDKHDHFSLNKFNGYIIVAPSDYTSIQLQRWNSDWSTMWNQTANMNNLQTEHNYVATKFDNSTIVCLHNNNHTTYGWPQVPAYWYTY